MAEIGKIVQKSVLLSKTLGVKRGLSPFTEDVFKFKNKKAEDCIYTIFRDKKNQIARTQLKNTTLKTERNQYFSYKTYSYESGKTVPYTNIRTMDSNGLRKNEIISTIQNEDKLDITKSQLTTIHSKNGNINEKSSILRFSKNKKPVGVYSIIKRDTTGEILSKKVYAQKGNGNKGKVITDLFYNTPVYEPIDAYNNIFKLLESEMGLKGYGIKVKSVHKGYNEGSVNNYASYNHKSKTISLNADNPTVTQKGRFASEIAHELLHAWQYREVELLEQGLLSGARKEAAKVYKQEFSNYVKASKNLEEYKKQTVENKAKEFQKFVKQYYSRCIKNIYNHYVKGIIPPQVGITYPIPEGELKKIL